MSMCVASALNCKVVNCKVVLCHLPNNVLVTRGQAAPVKATLLHNALQHDLHGAAGSEQKLQTYPGLLACLTGS